VFTILGSESADIRDKSSGKDDVTNQVNEVNLEDLDCLSPSLALVGETDDQLLGSL